MRHLFCTTLPASEIPPHGSEKAVAQKAAAFSSAVLRVSSFSPCNPLRWACMGSPFARVSFETRKLLLSNGFDNARKAPKIRAEPSASRVAPLKTLCAKTGASRAFPRLTPILTQMRELFQFFLLFYCTPAPTRLPMMAAAWCWAAVVVWV